MSSRCRWTLNDLPANVRSQVLAKLATPSARTPRGALDGLAVPAHVPGTIGPRTGRSTHGRQPNKTEAAYRARHLAGLDARYEALTFRLSNGHRYTPDWVVFRDGAPVECHEVKGAYRFASHGRSRLAFDQARVEFPGLRWVWGAPR